MVNTSATSPPASRTASTAFSAEPPVVVTSSTITTRLPCRLSPFASPSTASRAPCSFGFLRTKNAAIGWPLIQDNCAIAHGRLEIEVEIAFAARSQRDFATAERALANDLGEAGAGG